MFTIATVNVNGIRAAARKGMSSWLDQVHPDVLCLQEVRAPEGLLATLLPEDLHVSEQSCAIKGRAGVAVASRMEPVRVRCGLGIEGEVHTGRWAEVDFDTATGPLTVVSVYVHSGEVDTPKQEAKYQFLDAMTARMSELLAGGTDVVLCGDFNVGHTELDIKNWRGNRKNSGFLPEERAYFDRWFDSGWVDVARTAAGAVDGPYTWWSWRGKAFDNDTGWRIDYQIASPSLAEKVRSVRVDRAAAYDQRWSDHAPLVVEYDL